MLAAREGLLDGNAASFAAWWQQHASKLESLANDDLCDRDSARDQLIELLRKMSLTYGAVLLNG